MFLRKYLLIPILVLLSVLALYYFEGQIGILKKIELDTLDLRFKIRGRRQPDKNIAIIAIDEKSIAEIGRWPWDRGRIARMIGLLHRAGAEVIALDIIFSEPYAVSESGKIEELEQTLSRYPEQVPQILHRQVQDLKSIFNADRTLAETLAAAADVIGAVYFTLPGEKGKGLPCRRDAAKVLKKSRYRLIANKDKQNIYPVLKAREVTANIPVISGELTAEGFVNYTPDIDGLVRKQPAVIEYGGNYYSSLAIQAARLFLGIPPVKIKLLIGEKIRLGIIDIPLSEDNNFYINYYGPNESFPYYSFSDVLSGAIDPAVFKGKIVIIGGTDPALWDIVSTPFSTNLPGVEIHANILANILAGDYFKYNNFSKTANVLAVIALILLSALLLPRLPAFAAALVFVALFGGYFFIAQLLFNRLGLWLNLVYPLLALTLNFSAITIRSLIREQREKKRIKKIFSSCVAKSVVDEILAHPEKLKLGGERRLVTVLFSDIANFTGISEKISPENTAGLLNEYFTEMAKIIIANKGTIDKYMGDGLMAVFGAPLSYPDHARFACRAALEMLQGTKSLGKSWSQAQQADLSIRIGINTGEVMAGYIGSPDIMNYTVIGREVNIAQRLEGVNRKYNTSIIIGETTYEYVKADAEVRLLEPARVQGVEQILNLYELESLK